MEFSYLKFLLYAGGLAVFLFFFNMWYFRRLQTAAARRQRKEEEAHIENIKKWKSYAVTCKKFENGECDLSIACDTCSYYKEPEDE